MSVALTILLLTIGAVLGAVMSDYYRTWVAVSRMPHLGERVSFIEGKVRHFGTFVGRDGAARRVLLDDGTGHTVSVYDQVIPVNPRPWKNPPPPPPMTYREMRREAEEEASRDR